MSLFLCLLASAVVFASKMTLFKPAWLFGLVDGIKLFGSGAGMPGEKTSPKTSRRAPTNGTD